MARANLVVTCTKGKTRQAAPELQLGGIRADSPEARAELWIEALNKAEGGTGNAFDLYSGGHWSVVRSLPDVALRTGTEVQLWILSAGYGLISADAQLHPYSATFSTPNPDQVHRFSGVSRRESHRRWWAALTKWEGPQPGEPRTIRELAERAPGTPIVAVGSESYLDPVAADLRNALEVLDSPGLLMMLSGGMDSSPGLERNLIPYDARLSAVLRGALMSLNARVAREILERGVGLSVDAVTEWIEEFGRELPRFAYPVNTRTSVGEVKDFIRRELAANPEARCSPLHKKLRKDLRLACEQKRFRDLFLAVRAEADAQGGLRL